MVRPDIGLEKIIIVTKELGTVVFTNNYKWSNFKMCDITLHSLTQPSFQEYFENGSSRFVWFYNGKHHRYDGPAIYSFGGSKPINHKFDLTKIPFEDIFGYGIYNTPKNSATCVYFYLDGVSYGQYLTDDFLEKAKLYSRSAKLKYLFKDDE